MVALTIFQKLTFQIFGGTSAARDLPGQSCAECDRHFFGPAGTLCVATVYFADPPRLTEEPIRAGLAFAAEVKLSQAQKPASLQVFLCGTLLQLKGCFQYAVLLDTFA